MWSNYSNTHERMKGGLPVQKQAMHGLYRAEVTGDYMPGDNQYIEVKVKRAHYYARPCWGFGSRVAAPSQEFLKKYKGDIFFWVAFEEAKPDQCVWLGWCWNDGRQKDIPDFPESAYYRTRMFKEEINDKTGVWTVYFDDGTNTWYKKFGKDGWQAKMTALLFEATGDMKLVSKKMVLQSDRLYFGSEDATEAGVLGNALNTWLGQLNGQVSTLATLVGSIANAAASGTTNPGSATALSTLSVQVTDIATRLNAMQSQLTGHLSKKIILE